jgi:hypothetical protein
MEDRKRGGTPKNKFTAQEDELLKQLVDKYGTDKWFLIAEEFPNRNGRQLRERWVNYVSPSVNNTPWTPEEDEILLANVSEYNNKWSSMTKLFRNRTDVAIKNRYIGLTRHCLKQNSILSPPPEIEPVFPPPLPLPLPQSHPELQLEPIFDQNLQQTNQIISDFVPTNNFPETDFDYSFFQFEQNYQDYQDSQNFEKSFSFDNCWYIQ